MNGERFEVGGVQLEQREAIKWNPSTKDSNSPLRDVGPFGRSGGADQSIEFTIDRPDKHLRSDERERAREEASSWAQLSPLMAATLGPLAVLLGIPCLTQRWHGTVLDPPLLPNGWSNFEVLPDPPLNLALAGITLFCEIMGNVFLVLRFSDFHAKVTTWMSYGFWILKIILGIANYIQFGIAHPQTEDVIYLEGYWVGVCGMGITVIIIIFLTFNLAFLHRQSKEETRRLHCVQREFMLQTLSFFLYLGIIALMFCRIEQRSYVQSIYFMVVTTLTIGFGDITPKTAAFKVLTFPFAVIGIALLALIVTSIVQLLADRARRRKYAQKKLQKKKEKFRLWARRKPSEPPRLERSLTLQEELIRLREEEWRRESRSNLRRVGIGLSAFLAFWFIGAVIFHLIEPWSYGNALYFCYVFFLTIGFGDYYPTTEAGRPIFIVYALLAVPTMTVVVDTVSTNFTAFMFQRVRRNRHQVYQEKHSEIQSMTSLVTVAKQKTCDTIRADKSVKLHGIAERMTDNLHHMNYHLQKLLAQKLGPDARHIIVAEGARLPMAEKMRLAAGFLNHHHHQGHPADEIAAHLSEVGKNTGDELEMLVEYRQFYAAVLADLLIVKENLAKLDKETDKGEKSINVGGSQ